MLEPAQSTIAQLLFADETAIDFARIVGELERVLSRLCGDTVAIAWDCDDLVTFDLDETRILLSWHDMATPNATTGVQGCLTVSVGPQSGPGIAAGTQTRHEVLCSRLVDRIQGRFATEAVIWHQISGEMHAEDVDILLHRMPPPTSALPPVAQVLDQVSRKDRILANAPLVLTAPVLTAPFLTAPVLHLAADNPPQAKPTARLSVSILAQVAHHSAHHPGQPLPLPIAANDAPDLPRPQDLTLIRLRAALYPPPDAATEVVLSTQMRLAAHAFNATLIVVWAPLGAAVMTYSLLRGEDMRLSARLMAICGTLYALAGSPIGHSMAASF